MRQQPQFRAPAICPSEGAAPPRVFAPHHSASLLALMTLACAIGCREVPNDAACTTDSCSGDAADGGQVDIDGSMVDPADGPENTNSACGDQVDNDGDGYVDCDDYDCSRSPSVTVCDNNGSLPPDPLVTLRSVGAMENPFDEVYLTAVTSLHFHYTEPRLLVGGAIMGTTGGSELHLSDGRLRVFDMQGSEPIAGSVTEFAMPITTARYSANGERIATGTHGSGKVLVYEPLADHSLELRHEDETCHDGSVLRVAWHPSDSVFFSVGATAFLSPGSAPDVCKFSVGDGPVERTKRSVTSELVLSDVSVSKTGDTIFVPQGAAVATRASSDLAVENFAEIAGADHKLIETMADGSLAVTSGRAFYFASPNYDPANPATSQLSGGQLLTPITALTAHPTLPLVAIGTEDGFLAIVSQHSGARLATTVAHGGPIYDVAWTPDGLELLSGGLAPALKAWTVAIE